MKIKNLLVGSLITFSVIGATASAWAEDVRMFARHEVADYGAWRIVYNNLAPTQKKMGIFFKAVYQSADNPNDVTIIHDFHSMEEAKAFAASPELKSAMEKAGVKGAPQIWFTTLAVK